ncbi:protein-disulfide reductase DsbD [Legionella sp. CNM-4043-24]|uniref:protein-disulfide reductase DsbD n=1 Tax=Legionella sp. CNM-4043-24 TaxID=3421646 RepID=UPI00403AFF61
MKRWVFILFCCFSSMLAFAEPPAASEVFPLEVKRIDPNTFVLNWDIKPGYFLYSDRIKITTPAVSNVHLGDIRYPKPVIKVDHQGRQYSVYRNRLSLPVAVLGVQPGEALLELHYQGCSDDGFCYPPETSQLLLTIGDNLGLASVALYDDVSGPESDKPVVAPSPVDQVFDSHHWPLILITFFGFGLLLAFTPCVLPMVPVLSGIIVGHGADLTTRKAFLLSLSYVLSMAATYAAVGAVVAMLGSNLQIIMQSPWVIAIFSLLFVLLALSMFGYYELKLPVSWQARLARINRNQANGHYLGAAIMGCLSTLILSPCVTAPLIGALGYIARSGNVILGSLSLFFLGLGMGTPLLLIGMSAGRWLPRAGRWMNAVKAFFGVMLLAVAIYLLGRILPAPLVMGLWAALLVFSGIYSGALVPARTHHEKFGQAVGILLLVYGLLVLVGASMGGSNPLQPLAAWAVDNRAGESLETKTVTSVEGLQQAIAAAQGKPVLLDFYADWCASCLEMEATTFKNPEVLKALAPFAVIKVDVTANNADSRALLQDYRVVAPPTFVFLGRESQELDTLRLVGETGSKEFLEHLGTVMKVSG